MFDESLLEVDSKVERASSQASCRASLPLSAPAVTADALEAAPVEFAEEEPAPAPVVRQAIPRAAMRANDALAPIMALSAEEKIALFT